MIDGILSDVASLICGVPQGSVLGLQLYFSHTSLNDQKQIKSQ